MNNIWSPQETLRTLSVIVLTVIGVVCASRDMLFLAISWSSILVILGNVRRLSRNNKLAYFLRMTLYFLPYAIPSFFVYKPTDNFIQRTIICCGVSILVFVLWLCFNYHILRFSFSDIVVAGMKKESKYVLGLRVYNLIGAAICEELFFRYFILSLSLNIVIASIISISLFILSHYLLPWGENYKRKDLLNQFIFGSINIAMFVLSHSVLPCIMMHMFFNSINILKYLKSYERHYIKKDYYDKIQAEKLSYPELDI